MDSIWFSLMIGIDQPFYFIFYIKYYDENKNLDSFW